MKKSKIKVVLFIYMFIATLTSFILPIIFDTLVPNCFSEHFYPSFLLVQLLGFGVPVAFVLFSTRTIDEQTGIKHITFKSVIPKFEEIELKQIIFSLLVGITAFYGFEFIKNGIELFLVANIPEYKYSSDFNLVSIKTFFVLTLLFAFIPSIFEEVLYRGMFFDTFKKNKVCLYLIPALAFAGMHKGVISFISAMFIGVVAMLIMVKTRQIILPIIMHFVYNVCSLVHSSLFAIPLSPKSELIEQSSKMELMSTGFFNFAISIVFLVTLCWVLNRIKEIYTKKEHLNIEKKFDSLFTKNERLLVGIFPIIIAIFSYVVNFVLV